MPGGVTYLCDRGTGTEDKKERGGRVCRSLLRSEVWQLQESVEQLTMQQVSVEQMTMQQVSRNK